MRTHVYAGLLFALVSLLATSAWAAPPTLDQLYQFDALLECRASCEHGKLATRDACLAKCPAPGADWDKDRNGKVDAHDRTLAYLEYWDAGTLTSICYENGTVVPIQACGLASCLAKHTDAECQDNDHDGLRRFQEDLVGTIDTQANLACTANSQCGGDFLHECAYRVEVDRSLCLPRACNGTCTAFHLEQVAQDNDRVIVRVNFDYAPVAATVLDLHIDYDANALALIDARPLAALTSHGKSLETRHTAPGKLRLLVLSPESSREVQTGPIAELLFSRIGSAQTSIAFSTSSHDRQWSLAPNPGAHRTDLNNSALWGSSISVKARDPNGPRRILHYSFENASAPLAESSVPSGQALADLSFLCTQPNACTPAEKAAKAALAAQAESMQRGSASVSGGMPGVYGAAGRFDGVTNHLELPVSLNGAGSTFRPADQSVSMSTWIYHEPNVARATTLHGDLLFSHNHGTSERTRFGLLAVPRGKDAFDLVWFEGDLGDANLTKTPIKTAIPDRRWTHVGFAVDGATSAVNVYVDGVSPQGLSLKLASPPALQCPALGSGGELKLHAQGDFDGGRAPEQLLFASAQNNLFGIERMDPRGLDRQRVLRPNDSTATDPDYSPVVDRMVYVSSSTGNYEIWVARADGSEPVQVTKGFGDTARGIFARRPHWAPDGSAIVFESNVFDVGAADNIVARGYHLYYVGYDPLQQRAVVTGQDGQVASQLVYSQLLATDTVLDFRLTKADGNQQHAVWLRGAFSESGHSYLGELLLESSDGSLGDKRVARLRIEQPINAIDAQLVSTFSTLESGATVGLLAAHRLSEAGKPAIERMFLEKQWVSYASATEYAVRVEPTADGPVAVVTYQPAPRDALCYDMNRNQACDSASEDRNGDGSCDAKDCMVAEVHDLFLAYELSAVAPAVDADGAVIASPGPWLATANKQLRVFDVHPAIGGDYVKIDVASPVNDRAIPAGTELARIALRAKSSAPVSLSLTERKVRQALYVKTNDAEPVPFVVQEGHLERVLEAVFSPDGSRLALAGISAARPVVVTTEDLAGTAGVDKASILPMRVEGLDWERVDRLYPCNWIGAYRNPYSGFYVSAFRGAVDELEVYNYARTAGAFESDAQRGRDQLVKDGRGGVLVAGATSCGSDLDCPAYQLCNSGKCEIRSCDPRDPYSCARGACSLEPVPVSLDASAVRWVCTVDCNADAQCFQQECLNGPCRFCSDKLACIECRETVQDVGGLKISSIEGCPDRNSFACEQGSCVTECYDIQDGNSKYLCDAATEYCNHGRCVAFDWSWSDLAPASFAGSGETTFDLPKLPVTTAISQLYPVEIEAYGVEDYGHPPELAIEGKIDTQGAQVYGTKWFDIGRVLVYNKTKGEAGNNKYVVYSPYPVTQLRLRLITPPYENMNAGSTGLLARDAQFCVGKDWSKNDRSACYRRPAGSRPTVGYPVSIPVWQARKAREERTGQEQGYDSRLQDEAQAYLYGGQPAVIIRGLKVNGLSVLGGAIQRNQICPYAAADGTGSTSPFDGDVPRKILFADVSKEQSNQKQTYFPNASATTLLDVRSVTKSAWAVLNCNFANPQNDAEVADLVVKVEVTYPNPGTLAKSGNITETKNGCRVETTGASGEVVYEPCHEWVGGAVSFDPMNDERQLHRTVDYYEFTSFGYEE